MDDAFLKFWGQFLQQAADGQRKVEDLVQWMRSGYSPSVDLAALFRQCYGLTPGTTSAEGDRWQKATSDFRKALEAYAPLWGWVPLERYDQLQNENERLKAELEKQERLIKRLEAILAEEDMGHRTMIARFQELIEDQSQAFEDLMQTLVPSPETADKRQT